METQVSPLKSHMTQHKLNNWESQYRSSTRTSCRNFVSGQLEHLTMSRKVLQGPGIFVETTSYLTRVKMTTRQVDGVGVLQVFVKVVANTIRPQSRLSAPVEEEGPNHGYDYGSSLQNGVTSTQLKEQITENCCGTKELQQLSNQIETLRRLCLFEEAMSQIEARLCCGTYQWKIKQFQQRRQDAITGAMVAQFSPAIYTGPDGYTFRIRMHLNGVNRGMGTHVAIFVHMMQGDCDNRLAWPFTGVITLSILDQSAAKDPKDITQVVVASPKLSAFRKPAASCTQIGCGFELFAPIDQICAEPFIQNNTMVVKIQISPLP